LLWHEFNRFNMPPEFGLGRWHIFLQGPAKFGHQGNGEMPNFRKPAANDHQPSSSSAGARHEVAGFGDRFVRQRDLSCHGSRYCRKD
jgi:hypothetical protein